MSKRKREGSSEAGRKVKNAGRMPAVQKDRGPAIDPSEPGTAIPSFELRYTSDAAADIKHLDGSIRKQLRKVLERKLAIDPEGYGLPLRGALTNYWKHEFGNHRIVYRIYLHSAWSQFARWGFGNMETSRTFIGSWNRSRRQGGSLSSWRR